MSNKNIKSDLEALDKLKDKDTDYSDIPEQDDSFFESAEIHTPKKIE